MPARIHMSKKELEDLIQVGKAAGTNTSQLEALLAEVAPEKPAGAKSPPVAVRRLEPERAPEELVTGPELERLRTLACPHIRSSPYWEDFVSRRVLLCTSCKQPALFDF